MKKSHKNPIIQRHAHMVDDPQRTPILEEAIKKIVKPGSTVFDLGCGLGVLTQFALNCGAKKVYACDIDDSISVAKERVKTKPNQSVQFFKKLSSEVKLPEKVDVILAETVGSLGFNENILPFLLDAKKRHLKKGGTILPRKLALWAAPLGSMPVATKEDEDGEVPFTIGEVKPEDLLNPGICLVEVDFLKNQYEGFDLDGSFEIEKAGKLHGFAGWMEIEWAPGVTTSTAPTAPLTHWKQGILPNRDRLSLKKGDQLFFRLRILPKEESFSTETVIEWGYQKGN